MAADAAYQDPYAQAIAQQAALLAQPLQRRYGQQEVAQRIADNQRMQQLGMLGLASGDEAMGAMGSQALRNAQAQAAPHVTERGSFDPLSGQFSENPEFVRQRQEAEMARLRQAQAAGQAAWQEARQKANENQERDRQRAQDQQVLRGMFAANAGATRQAAQDARNWTVEDRMADDFNRDTKNPASVLSAYGNLQALAQNPNAASDIALIFSYMKMLDPGSVVREGEFATAQNAASVPDQVRNAYNRTMTGERLNPEQRKQILGTAGALAAQATQGMDATAAQYAAKAQRRNLNPENITGRPAVLRQALGGQGAPAQPQPMPQQPAQGSAQPRYRVNF